MFIRFQDLIYAMIKDEMFYNIWNSIRRNESGYISDLNLFYNVSDRDLAEYIYYLEAANLITTTDSGSYFLTEKGINLTKAICAITDHREDYKYE